MGEFANKAVGKTKKAVGRVTGDRDLEAEGRIQEGAGKVQGGVKGAGRTVNRAIDKVGAKVSQARRKQRSRAERPAARRPAVKRTTRTTRTPRARRTTTKTVERY